MLQYFKKIAGVDNVIITEIPSDDPLVTTIRLYLDFKGDSYGHVFNRIENICRAISEAENNTKPLEALKTLKEFLR